MCDVFHENLKAARLKKGLSQQEVADLVGVAKSTYSMWETGNREPNLMRIKALRSHFVIIGHVTQIHVYIFVYSAYCI